MIKCLPDEPREANDVGIATQRGATVDLLTLRQEEERLLPAQTRETAESQMETSSKREVRTNYLFKSHHYRHKKHIYYCCCCYCYNYY